MKNAGAIDQSYLATIVGNNSMKLFEQTLFFKEAMEAQDYLQRNEKQIKGWLNVVVTKQTLNIRCEIDLNYIKISPSYVESFGWKLDQPLAILLDVDEVRLLNSFEREELQFADFKMMQQRSAIKYSCVNNASNKSFGCNDYMPKIF